MKSKVFETAWDLFKSNVFQTFSECLKFAWKQIKLVLAMKNGTVTISFRKSNGEITERLATLNTNLFNYESKGVDRPNRAGNVKFWSIPDNAFRSFRIERLISFN